MREDYADSLLSCKPKSDGGYPRSDIISHSAIVCLTSSFGVGTACLRFATYLEGMIR